MKASILIVEDDKGVREYLRNLLVENGFQVRSTDKGTEALPMVDEQEPNLVVLDLQLPDITGESVCQELKKEYPHIPVIMLTAKTSDIDKLRGFNVGADDYITKPFVADEFLARLRARLRPILSTTQVLEIGDLSLDPQKIEVKRGENNIHLTPQEFKLLQYLMQNKGIVLNREMILNRVWSYTYDVDTRVVDVYMGYLRKKIDAEFDKKLIHSVRGFGYTLKEE